MTSVRKRALLATRIALAFLATASLGGNALALSPFRIDEFGADAGLYPDTRRCPPADRPPAVCDKAHAATCALLDRADRFAQPSEKAAYLRSLVWLFGLDGLSAKAKEARAALDALGPQALRPGVPAVRLEGCSKDDAIDFMKRTEEEAKGKTDEERIQRVATALSTLAKRGITDGMKGRIEQLASQALSTKARRALAVAAAEIGEFQLAARLVPARDNLWSVRGEIAQLAARTGHVDAAVSLLGDPSSPEAGDAAVSEAKIEVVGALVRAGRLTEAETLSRSWKTISPGIVTRLDVARIEALTAATRDPRAALANLRKSDSFYDGNSCTNLLALLAAQSGLPDAAKALLDPDEAVVIDEERIVPSWGDLQLAGLLRPKNDRAVTDDDIPRLREEDARRARHFDAVAARERAVRAFMAASVATAVAYRDAGRLEDGVAVIERVEKVAHAQPIGFPGPNVTFAWGYAELGLFDRGWAAYVRQFNRQKPPPDADRLASFGYTFWATVVESLAAQGRIADALRVPIDEAFRVPNVGLPTESVRLSMIASAAQSPRREAGFPLSRANIGLCRVLEVQ